jgi:glycerol-3-phosphate cytidylyltransferase
MKGISKAEEKIIGYTSGVFDMFHVGHLNILKRAKSLCDKLIVGVTIDTLVGYKNTKTIIPFEERIEIIRSIKWVDLVVPQDDLDKFAMWKKLKFDVMFIGDDWFGTERFQKYEKDLAKVGVEIKYLPYTEGVSTSLIKTRIIDVYLQEKDKNT